MRRSLTVVALLLSVSGSLLAHDLFLKLTDYFVSPNTAVKVAVLNGTFSTSENYITRDRLADVSLVGGGKRSTLDTAAWTPSADEKSGSISIRVGPPGTYVLGASTRPRELKLGGKEFNAYLKEEGLTDMLAQRERLGELDVASNERYHKHVKAIFQVGDTRTDDFSVVLGYPAEIVPAQNPYELKVGAELSVRCLLAGQPAANVVVLSGGRTPSGARIPLQSVRTGADGIARLKITSKGLWYVKFISMEKTTRDGLTVESKWATLTFGVR
ncbi:MAG: DUF4198 domain-containing protein [Gemmatimonadaceae bacterium]